MQPVYKKIIEYNQNSPLTNHISSARDELPHEMLLSILQKISLKELISARQVNHTWLNVSKDPSIWNAFGSRLSFWGDSTEMQVLEIAKNALQKIQRIKGTVIATAEDVSSYLTLSKMGFHSLDETKQLASQVNYADDYMKTGVYYALAFEYLERNQPLELENILPKMIALTSRGVVASKLIEHYLKQSNFVKALSTMDFVKQDQLEWDKCFYSIVQAAYTVENYAFTNQVLKKYSLPEGKVYSVWAGCVVALQKLLIENGKIDEANQLNSDFPQAFHVAHPLNEMKYYIFIHDLKKAEAIALKCKAGDRYFAFGEIKKYYEKNKNEVEAKRIGDILINF